MERKVICDVDTKLVVNSGVSSKTGKPYEFLTLSIDTGVFGIVDVKLNTVSDKAGIILKLVADNSN